MPQKLSRRLKRAHHSHPRKAVKHLGTSIDKRPQSIDKRQYPFDWEGDLVKGVRRDLRLLIGKVRWGNLWERLGSSVETAVL